MSVPTGSDVEAQARSSGASPSPTADPCPSGDVPKEGSRDIQQKGKIISVPHDWCKSTDSPVPYKIWAWQSSASNLANTVRQTDCRSHVLGSIVNQCYGDEPGTGGGVKSGTNLAECTPLSASPTVRAQDKPMVRFLDKWWMNHKNTWGCLNNSEDMGKYDLPKVQEIDAKLSPNSSRADTKTTQASKTLPNDENVRVSDTVVRLCVFDQLAHLYGNKFVCVYTCYGAGAAFAAPNALGGCARAIGGRYPGIV